MCPRECLVIISKPPGLSFGLEMIGPLSAIIITVFYLLVLYLSAISKPLQTCLLVFTVNPWSKLLVNTFCSSLGLTLLFIESNTIHPLYLWVIRGALAFMFCYIVKGKRDTILPCFIMIIEPSWCYDFIFFTLSSLCTFHEIAWIHKLYYPCSSYHALVKYLS